MAVRGEFPLSRTSQIDRLSGPNRSHTPKSYQHEVEDLGAFTVGAESTGESIVIEEGFEETDTVQATSVNDGSGPAHEPHIHSYLADVNPGEGMQLL